MKAPANQHFVCLVASGHPRVGESHIRVLTSGAGHAIVDKILAGTGIERKIALKLPRFQVKQHWRERYHADVSNRWLRQTVADLLLE